MNKQVVKALEKKSRAELYMYDMSQLDSKMKKMVRESVVRDVLVKMMKEEISETVKMLGKKR